MSPSRRLCLQTSLWTSKRVLFSWWRVLLTFPVLASNTYTNKTWSEVSGIELGEVNRMEREFLLGLDFDLYVNKSTYESWLKFLTGLVMNKEKDSKRWQRTRYPVRTSHLHRPGCHRHAQLTPSRASSHRARSTSPRRASICIVSHPVPCPPLIAHYTPQPPSPLLRPSRSKRTAADAFSPTSASFSAAALPPAQVPRRMQGLSLDIPQPTAQPRESSASPLESLQSFSKLSLETSPIDDRTSPAWPIKHDGYPRTLVSSYQIDDQRLPVAPQVSMLLSLSHLGVS